MRPLRIGLVIDRLDPAKGGAEAYLHDLGCYLVRRGHDVHHLARHFGPRLAGGTPRPVPLPALPRALREVGFDRAAARLARDLKLDVTLGVRHTPAATVFQPHGGVYSSAIAAQCRSAGRRAWLHRIGRALSPTHHALLHLERRQRRRRDRVTFVALSCRVQADMARAYGLDDDHRPVLIYNGVDTGRFHPAAGGDEPAALRRAHGLAPDAFLALFMGHNFRLKGLGHLLNALARLDETVCLLVVGRGRAAPYQAQLRALRLGERVVFAGETARPETFFRAADVLAHPTYHDPCSSVCLEALACGLPVITTRANGVGELIEQHGGGLVLDEAGDEAALAGALAALAADRARRRVLGGEARRLAEAHPAAAAFAAMERVLEGAAPGA